MCELCDDPVGESLRQGQACRVALVRDMLNLANIVTHRYWHVIPCFRDGRDFSKSVWDVPMRERERVRAAPPNVPGLCNALSG